MPPTALHEVPTAHASGVSVKKLNGLQGGQMNGASADKSHEAADAAFPLEELSWTITKNASIVSQYLGSNGLPQPSFNSDGPETVLPGDSPQAIQQARQKLIAASLELYQLAVGPSEFLPNLATGVHLPSPQTHIPGVLTVFSSNISPVLLGSANTKSSTSCL
jgi:hypothetical protein